MGGKKKKKARWILNISTVFLLSGIWHGATWSFVLWGAIHAALYLAEHFIWPKRPNIFYHILIFIMITFAWIFFRIPDIGSAWHTVTRICTDLISPISLGSSAFSTILTFALLVAFVIREYFLYSNKAPRKTAFEYIALLLMIGLFGAQSDQFVYFQF